MFPTFTYTVARGFTFTWYADMKFKVNDGMQYVWGRSILAEGNTPGAYPTIFSTLGFSLAGATTGLLVAPIACTRPAARCHADRS
jgi:hypothetical protein